MGHVKRVFKKDVVFCYRMEESTWDGTADEVKDSGPFGFHAEGINGATTERSKYQRGGFFDGDTDYVFIGDAADMRISGNLSIGFWIKTTDTGQAFIIHQIAADADKNYTVDMVAGAIRYTHGDSDGTSEILSSLSVVNDGTWCHCVIVCDYSNIYFYKNGVLVKTETMTFDNVASTGTRRIGHPNASLSYGGSLDELFLMSRALIAEEVKDIYNSGLGRFLTFLPQVEGPVETEMVKSDLVEEL